MPLQLILYNSLILKTVCFKLRCINEQFDVRYAKIIFFLVVFSSIFRGTRPVWRIIASKKMRGPAVTHHSFQYTVKDVSSIVESEMTLS